MPVSTPAEQRESQGRAAIGEKASVGGGKVGERARAIRAEQAKRGSREALQSMAEPPLPNAAKRESTIDSRMGWEKGVDGKKVRATGSAEEKVFNDAKDADKLPAALVEKGYDTLTPAEKTTVRTQVENSLRARMPDLADAVFGPAGTPRANRDAILDDFIKSERFRAILRTTHGENLSKALTTTDAQILAAKKNAEAAAKLDTDKDTDITRLTTEKTDNQTKLDEFNPGGASRTELDKLNASAPKIESEISSLDKTVESLETLLHEVRINLINTRVAKGAADPAVKAIETEIKAKEAELKKTNDQLFERRGRLRRRDELVAEEKKFKEEKTRLDKELTTAQKEKNETMTQKLEAETALQNLKNQRTGEEAEYVNGLNSSIAETAAKLLQENLTNAQSVEADVIKKEADDNKDADMKKVLDKLAQDGLIWNAKKRKSELSKGVALANGNIIKDPARGLDSIVQSYITAGVTIPSPEYDRLMEKMKDKEFLDAARAKVGPTLVARYLQAGGKFSEGDAMYLRGTDWGQNLIENGLKEKEEIIKAIEGLKGQGAVDKSFFEKVKSMDNKSWLRLALLVLAGAAAVGAVPIAGAVVGVL